MDRAVSCVCRVEEGTAFRGDVGDLLEILGNLLDNAFKYGGGMVRVIAGPSGPGPVAIGGLVLTVEDDGPGIPEAEMAAVLERGARMDQSEPGQGIGLAVVNELAMLHGGKMEIARSELGGVLVRLDIPPHGRT